MIAWGKQYFWKPPIVATEVCQRCQICPKYNPGKPIHILKATFFYLLVLLLSGNWILSGCLPLKDTDMFWQWFVCIPIGWKPFLADEHQPLQWPKCC